MEKVPDRERNVATINRFSVVAGEVWMPVSENNVLVKQRHR